MSGVATWMWMGFDEIQKLMETNGEEEEKKELREAFGMYDMDGSGRITPTSLRKMLSRLGGSHLWRIAGL